MVTPHAAVLALLLAVPLQACSAVEGTVLRSRTGRAPMPDSGVDSGASDGGAVDARTPDAAPSDDAGPNTRGVCRIGGSRDGFYENFNGSALDSSRWLIAHGPFAFAGASARGGFARDNVQVRDGALRLLVRGDRYEGSVRSIEASGTPLTSGKRSAAAIASRDLFGSGTYQAQGLLTGPSPVEVAIWFVRDDDSAGAIDLTTPGENASQRSYGYVRMRTRDSTTANDVQFALGEALDPAAPHILRFDWYTTAQKSVSFWIDDALRAKSMRALPPTAAGRLWIVAWIPGEAAADFDTVDIRLDNAFITPFGNNGDQCADGELKGPSLTLP